MAAAPQLSRQRSTKLHEFVAHASAVNCLSIGRKSAAVMVTGGDDKKVNVWAIGQATALMSLAGHTSPVECVCFDSNEQTVIAGSSGGTLKLWDLDQGKVARTLTGHRSNCIAVQWHPYGEFFASGSVDTNLKIWDIRRKTCIQTYKGHTSAVRQILFSPDGRWVVSGGDDGLVKLWDLTMGRLVHEFTLHSGPISAIAIHPTEFLMATAAADRTLRMWDLESFEQVCCMPPESGPVRRVTFSHDGAALLSGGEDSLKLWGWEPVRCYDHLDVRWSRLGDFCVGPNQQLIAGSVREAVVAVWNVGLDAMKPFSSSRAPPLAGDEARALTPQCSRAADAEPSETTARAPRPAGVRASVWSAPSSAPCHRTQDEDSTRTESCEHDRGACVGDSEVVSGARSRAGVAANDGLTASCARMHIADCRARIAAVRTQPTRVNSSEVEASYAPYSEKNMGMDPAEGMHPVGSGMNEGSSHETGERKSVGTSMGNSIHLAPRPSAPTTSQGIILTSANAVAVAKQAQKDALDIPRASKAEVATNSFGLENMAELLHECQKIKSRLTDRLGLLRYLRELWSAGDVRKMFVHLLQVNDSVISVDILRAGVLQSSTLDLECASLVLASLIPLLSSRDEDRQYIALEAIASLLHQFGPLIHSSLAVVPDAVGVDLSAEARQQRCQACYARFSEIRPLVDSMLVTSGRVRSAAANVRALLQSILHME